MPQQRWAPLPPGAPAHGDPRPATTFTYFYVGYCFLGVRLLSPLFRYFFFYKVSVDNTLSVLADPRPSFCLCT